jgi:hypothetical protein
MMENEGHLYAWKFGKKQMKWTYFLKEQTPRIPSEGIWNLMVLCPFLKLEIGVKIFPQPEKSRSHGFLFNSNKHFI